MSTTEPTPARSDANENNQQGINNNVLVQSSAGNNQRRNENRFSQMQFGSNERSWEGAKPEIGVVLGLKCEKLTHKVTFDVFIEKVVTYVLSEFKNAKDILPALRIMINPLNGMRERC